VSEIKCEIDVWVINNVAQVNDGLIAYKAPREGYTKAKLVIPVEPAVVEIEDVEFMNIGGSVTPVCAKHSGDNKFKPLLGRRWKCRFEEIV
jgi:hypothetical protein